MELKNKSFIDCTLTFMDKAFKMREEKDLPVLTNWLNAPNELNEFERRFSTFERTTRRVSHFFIFLKSKKWNDRFTAS